MRQGQSQGEYSNTLHDAVTDPALTSVTAPLSARFFPPPRETWLQRFGRRTGALCAAIIRKLKQLLNLSLVILLLLLFTRFTLILLTLSTSSLFARWTTLLSDPLVLPFNGLVTPFLYQGYIIDVTTLIAILTYTIAIRLVYSFLKILTPA